MIMNKRLALTLLLSLPLLLAATTLQLSVPLPSGPDALSGQGCGAISAPGLLRLPVKTVNVLLPPNAENISFSHALSGAVPVEAPAPESNPGFTDGEQTLTAPQRDPGTQRVQYLGLLKWGDLRYASFRVLPAIWTGDSWLWSQSLDLTLTWSEGRTDAPGRVPPVYRQLEKRGGALDFFANPGDLAKWYDDDPAKLYDCLIITTTPLHAALNNLELYHQSLGLLNAFADVTQILASSPGATPAEKVRNYIIDQYNLSPFTYLLLVGDHDTVPVAMLTPEPDGFDTVASDFYYSDLSSIFDTDGDTRLGEYSTGMGDQDWGVDYTPEVFVGRISTNTPATVTQIASRTVLFDQSAAPWKNKALLPAAFLNYQGEPEPVFLQTDGADFMEYARNTALSGMDCTTMYEHVGVVQSHPSTYDLSYPNLIDRLNTESFGLLNWSAHGSSGSSSRKVWMSDDNGNQMPDDNEMQWMDMVDRYSFNNLSNTDGMVIFAASCYNGMIDGNQACISEYALAKKAVAVMGATRTGWYKIGWANPGWGGLSSYNLHLLENYVANDMSLGAAFAYTNLLHTQYYLFGDPVDSGGIIWPELQNVYTYLLYGDPVIGHVGSQTAPRGEILVYEPMGGDGLEVVNALNAAGRWNVVYTDRLIPDYDYVNNFEAVFCLFGWGDTAYILEPNSLEYNLLNGYLENGGRMYLEGLVPWDPADPFWGKFGTSAPLDYFAFIEALRCGELNWDYDQTNPTAQILVPTLPSALPVIETDNENHPDSVVGIYNTNGGYATLASSFALAGVLDGTYTLSDLVGAILDTLHVGEGIPVANDDPVDVPQLTALGSHPNPFSESASISFSLKEGAPVSLDIYNLRGQKVRSLFSAQAAKGDHTITWNGRDDRGRVCSSGIYLCRLSSGGSALTGKLLKLAE
jgi:hypothetical protein